MAGGCVGRGGKPLRPSLSQCPCDSRVIRLYSVLLSFPPDLLPVTDSNLTPRVTDPSTLTAGKSVRASGGSRRGVREILVSNCNITVSLAQWTLSWVVF